MSAQARIADVAERARGPRISFEFFPPKTEALEGQLWESIRKLEPLQPSFVSVTYGAGGTTRDRTHRTVARILNETTLRPAAHLTCVSASRLEVDNVLREYRRAGVKHIVGATRRSAGRRGAAILAAPAGLHERG